VEVNFYSTLQFDNQLLRRGGSRAPLSAKTNYTLSEAGGFLFYR
jgi:hypothetical protein